MAEGRDKGFLAQENSFFGIEGKMMRRRNVYAGLWGFVKQGVFTFFSALVSLRALFERRFIAMGC